MLHKHGAQISAGAADVLRQVSLSSRDSAVTQSQQEEGAWGSDYRKPRNPCISFLSKAIPLASAIPVAHLSPSCTQVWQVTDAQAKDVATKLYIVRKDFSPSLLLHWAESGKIRPQEKASGLPGGWRPAPCDSVCVEEGQLQWALM